MSQSASVVGRETIAFFKKGCTWGAEATAGDEIYLADEGMNFSQTLELLEESNNPWHRKAELGPQSVAANFSQWLRFDDARSLAFCLGSADYATPTELHSGKGDFQHVIFPAADNTGDFFTLAIRKGPSIVHTYPSVKVSGFSLSGQAQPQRIRLKANTIADQMTNSSALITPAVFQPGQLGPVPSGNGGVSYFRNFRFYCNNQTAATLSSADELTNSVTAFEFTFQRHLAADFTNSSGIRIEEPVEDHFSECRLSLELRSIDSDSEGFLSDMLTAGAKKLKFELAGSPASAATGSVADASLVVEAPHAVVESADPGSFAGPGRIPSRVTFRLLAAEATTDAPGMNWMQPFRLTLVNAQSAKAVN